ncbi:hypothetical protein [Desemzia sp. FAM 23989]|uniref:hypothetical protein n=1 Tax=Desemzia sp. FAM 23989 TaxID=3259523 RepID=UPI003883B08A
MKRNLVVGLLQFLVVGLFLAGCSSDEATNDTWHSIAEEEGVILQATDPVTLLFSENGVEADYSYWDPSLIIDFPFESGEVYADYEVIREDDKVTIQVGEEIQYKLTIVGDRLFRDEDNALLFKTDSFLVEYESSEE